MLSSLTVKHSKLECALYSMEPLEIRKKHNKLMVDLCDLMYIESPGYKNFIGFLNNADIPAGRLQQVKRDPMDLFHLMEERGKLKVGQYSVLEEALDASGNKEALDLVKKRGAEITKQIKGQGSSTIEETKQVTETRIKKKEESFRPPGEPEPAPKKQKTSVPVGWVRINDILYQKEPVLGHGCHGTIVYRGKFDKRDVAVKRLQREHFSLLDREVDLLREADKNHQHPNVIRYFCKEEDSNFLYIALELCEGTLQDYVEDKFQNEINIKPIKLLHQVLSGVAHLHSLGIVHRDLKPHNILISSPSAQDEVRAMISDFGLSKKLPPGKRSFSSRSDVFGTEGWVAPEMLKSGQRKTLAVDIFSAGCLMYYVLTKGQHPFGNGASEIQYKIEQGIFNLDKLPMTSDGEITKDIIQKMLSAEPGTRPTAIAVLHHLLFWDKEKKLTFIQDASDWLEVNTVRNLEQNGAKIFRDDWIKMRHQYKELSEDVKKSLGSLPEQFLDFLSCSYIHTVLWNAVPRRILSKLIT